MKPAATEHVGFSRLVPRGLALVLTTGRVLGIELAGRLLAQALLLYVARLLGPREFGLYALGITIFGVVSLLTDFGTTDSSVQRYTGQAAGVDLFRDSVARNRLMVAGVATAIALGIMVVARNYHTVVVVLTCTCAALPQALMTNRALEHRISERFSRASLVLGWSTAVVSVGACLGALVGGTAFAAALGFLVAALAGSAVAAARGVPCSVSARNLASTFRVGSPFFITALAVNLYTRGDRFFVAAFAGAASLGNYTAAYTLVFGFSMIGAALQVVTFPRLRGTFLGSGHFGSWRKGLLLLLGGGFALTFCLMAASGTIVTVIYGGSYSQGAELIVLLAPLIPFYLINPVLANILIVAGRERVLAGVALVNLGVAITGYLIGGSLFGAQGIAVASVAVEACGALHMLCRLRRSISNDPVEL